MALALGAAKVKFKWDGDAIAFGVGLSADYAVAGLAQDAIAVIQPAAPVDTGSLQSSIHAAQPGYARDESPLYNRRIKGVYVEARRQPLAEILPLVRDGAVWVGSWIFYAYYVERGAYNALAGRTVAGRNFIGPNAQAMVRSDGNFRVYFNYRWDAWVGEMYQAGRWIKGVL